MTRPHFSLPLAGTLATLFASAASLGTGGCSQVPAPEPRGMLSEPRVSPAQRSRGVAKTTVTRRPLAARSLGVGTAENTDDDDGGGNVTFEIGTPIIFAPGRMTDAESSGVGGCRAGMVSVEGRFCVDRFEGSLVEPSAGGDEVFHSPYEPVNGQSVRAVSVAGRHPQGYISGKQAKRACAASGKRLCKGPEWRQACAGPEKATWSYGSTPEPGRCNDQGKSPITLYLASVRTHDATSFRFSLPQEMPRGQDVWSWPVMNSPALNQYEGTLAATGSHAGCTNGYGVYDMVGNLHEWIDDPDGTFLGGYYQDVTQNGDGCGYRTAAHEFAYHDYSTGFRCCADLD